MATSGRPVGRPAHAHSTKNWEPGDETIGNWSLEQLLFMHDKFVARMEHAFTTGAERRPPGAQAINPISLVGSGGLACAHCGRVFIPRMITAKHCSSNCCQLAYLQRKRCA